MKFFRLLRAAICVAAMMITSSAQATTLQWTLENVLFSDGGSLFGTFSTDSTSGNLQTYDLTSTSGKELSGFHYNATSSLINTRTPNSFLIANISPLLKPYLNLSFERALTTGGINTLNHYGTSLTGGSWECTNCSPWRHVISGYATTVPAVPEPETYGMMLMGLGLMGFVARRRKNSQA